ncbi:Clp protease N-terminal domain-containing protein [Nocardia sp. NPDC003963]
MTESEDDLPYNPRLRNLLAAAEAIARDSGQRAVGAEHLQLAILGDAAAIPTQVLHKMGWDAEAFTARLRELIESAGYNGPGSPAA